jgi:hypothetical protein
LKPTNTVLELYLSNDMNFPSRAESNGKFAADRKDSAKEKDSLVRRDKELRLLKSAWPFELEHPL